MHATLLKLKRLVLHRASLGDRTHELSMPLTRALIECCLLLEEAQCDLSECECHYLGAVGDADRRFVYCDLHGRISEGLASVQEAFRV